VSTAPDAPVITDCYMNVDGLTTVTWLPSAESDQHQVPGSEFFIDYSEVGKKDELLEELRGTRNVWQSLAYSPPGIAVLPPSKRNQGSSFWNAIVPNAA